jgi:membrane protein DedA with SNARE-associated domain
MGLTEWLMSACTQVIDALGYPGIVLLMTLESMIAPVPSEAVMPFAGMLAGSGRLTWTGVLLASSVGSLIGSAASYALGYYGGRPLVLRFGRWLLLNPSDLDWAVKFFERRGGITVLIARFIPVVRHLISVPAGIGKMRLVPFVSYTLIGATTWNMFLAWLGHLLGANWARIEHYSKPIDAIVLVALFAAAIFFVRGHWRASARS